MFTLKLSIGDNSHLILLIVVIIDCRYNACRYYNIKGDDYRMKNRINTKDVVNNDFKIKQLAISKKLYIVKKE